VWSIEEGRGGAQLPGDGLRFDDFYRREYRAMFTLATALCRDSHAAEDVVQDAFVALHGSWERISHYDDPGAWVRRVIANKAVSRWRRLASETRALARLGRADLVTDLPPDERDVWRQVRRLPRRQAQAIALVYLDGLMVREVAAVLKIDEATVKTHLQRGRRALAKQLALGDDEEMHDDG
jgi:RNA polymerase sigma-70 factor (ECF subfamily)